MVALSICVDALLHECSDMGDKKIIVFVNTRHNSDVVSRLLYDKGYNAAVLHGGKTQVRPPHFIFMCTNQLFSKCGLLVLCGSADATRG